MQHTQNKTGASAKILRFARPVSSRGGRRGRPKSAVRGTDYGTPELVLKRKLGQTSESLDLCLERGLITPQQHWCGIHLRWLYTLRHGAPSLRALNPAHLGGALPRSDDPHWRTEREQEYRDAVQALSMGGNVALVVNLCVYNERPKFLETPPRISQKQQAVNTENLRRTRDGLDVLVKLWRNRPA
ncbi:MAG: hypothetical protein EBV03_05685 [Proteobacteria bacterium]|nr:hypothetical protein [Pseudomonadota bacterium]